MSDKNTDFERAALASSKNIEEYEGEDLEFSDLDDLDQAFEKEEIVLVFKGSKTGKQTKILVRQLTPGEVSDIEGSLLSDRVIKAISLSVAGSKQSTEAFKDAAEERSQKSFEKMVKCVQRAIIKPSGVTEDRISKWEPARIWDIYDIVVPGGRSTNAVDTFPVVDNTEQESSSDNPENSEG